MTSFCHNYIGINKEGKSKIFSEICINNKFLIHGENNAETLTQISLIRCRDNQTVEEPVCEEKSQDQRSRMRLDGRANE